MKRTNLMNLLTVVLFVTQSTMQAADPIAPMAAPDLVFDEVEGIVAVEAEHFYKQTLTDKRAWHITSSKTAPDIKPDADPAHVAGASGGAYVEILPDTRATHGHKLIHGENFSDKPGALTVAHYKVNIKTPGRYYVWVRSFSTGSEDNGVHVGLNGHWPESGQRWQTVRKQNWAWECKQRTQKVHTGVPMQLFLDIEKAGEHEIMFSLREDGFEMDKFVLAHNKEFKPEGQGPSVKVKSGTLPAALPEVVAAAPAPKTFPAHWGGPPAIQTGDSRPLPGGFGEGSSTLAKWIQDNLDKDAVARADSLILEAKSFSPEGTGYYLDRGKWLAINPAKEEAGAPAPLVLPRKADGTGTVEVSGEMKEWHKVTLTLDGPYAHELDNEPNPFTDNKLTITFTHESGAPSYKVPGYFAADGDAGESSAEAGTKWRAHLSPDEAGTWNYSVSFTRGRHAALDGGGAAVKPFDGLSGSFKVGKSDKNGRDFRAKGRLQYVNGSYLQFAGTKEYFLKAGADAPENFLSYRGFDGDFAKDGHKDNLVKDWKPHIQDWKQGDPTWQDGKGKGIIGALNYLSAKGANAVSFLTMNIVGDDQNVFPFVSYDDYAHLDVSRLEQWEIVFAHAQRLGLFLHFKTQEAENQGLLDAGKTGRQRKLYYRELIARFGHHLALNWNMGEEIGPWEKNPRTPPQLTPERLAMAEYFHKNDPYRHHVVIHNGMLFDDLLGTDSRYTGVSIQCGWNAAHQKTLEWLRKSGASGNPWAVANDEQNPADMGVPPDPGYQGHNGEGIQGGKVYTLHDIRKNTLWGTLMAGGWGVEYYFGYKLPQSDIACEDFRSREKSWDYCRIALDFFRDNGIPFWAMKNANSLIGNTKDDNSRYCFAKAGELYLVYLPDGGETQIDLAGASGEFRVKWFNPREGGEPQANGNATLNGGSKGTLTAPSPDDWLAVIAREKLPPPLNPSK